MRFVVRVVATLLLGSFLLTPAFADDAAKASSNSTTPEASTPAAASSLFSALPAASSSDSATSNAYLAPAVPVYLPQAKAKTSSSSDQITPVADLFVGYSYIRFSTNTLGNKEHFNLHGLDANIAGNINHWFSLVGDFGVHRIKDLPPGVSGSAYTYMFGPRFSHRGERWTPFLHVLFGAARLADIQGTPPTGSAFFNRSFSENAFATALGGGIDVNFNKH